jgi:hypothetical protein
MRVDFSSSDQSCSVFRATVYWSSIFILPKEVCKVIDQILRSFLWHGAVGISKAAKVAWDVVYLPREEGGLGLKRVHDWNKAAITRHLWNIASNSHTIWASWIKSYLLKGRSAWGIPVPNDSALLPSLRKTKSEHELKGECPRAIPSSDHLHYLLIEQILETDSFLFCAS